MKVIKQGIDPATKEIRATCSNCKTEIEFLPHEARYSSDQRDGDFYSVDCPTCKRIITKDVREYIGGQQWHR